MIVRYSSNNSGGDWWLTDADWHALEAAGWKVQWVKDNPQYKGDRFLGTLAMYATLECKSVKAAIAAWERIVGQDASAEGCECCGPPHAFREVVYDYD